MHSVSVVVVGLKAKNGLGLALSQLSTCRLVLSVQVLDVHVPRKLEYFNCTGVSLVVPMPQQLCNFSCRFITLKEWIYDLSLRISNNLYRHSFSQSDPIFRNNLGHGRLVLFVRTKTTQSTDFITFWNRKLKMTLIRKFRNYRIVMIQRSNGSIFEVIFLKCVFHRNNSTVTFQFEITGDMVITWDMNIQKLY